MKGIVRMRGLILGLAFFLIQASAGADCPIANPELKGPPITNPGGIVQPVRNDPGGHKTITLALEDPQDLPEKYVYYPRLTIVGDQEQGTPGVENGTFSHHWQGAENVVTYGVYVYEEGQYVRIPLFLVENAPSDDLGIALTEAALAEANPVVNNAAPFVLNTLFPSPEMLGQLLPVWLMYFNQYPQSEGYVDHEPVYVWPVYRTTPSDQIWSGFVLMHNGNVRTLSDGQTQEACRRTRLGAVARTSAGTLYLGGIYLQDVARGTDSGESFTAEQKITVGSTVGTAPEWTDVPLLVVSQQEHKEGNQQYVIYPDSQRDEISVGVEIGGKFMPLVGTRADANHSQPPEAQNRLVSLGVYDTTGSYHPVLGGRAHFENHPADAWALEWVNSGGPGSQSAGGWEADVGVFDPFGSFVPLAGVTYADSIEGAIHPYQMMITTGVWAGETYQPMVGTTYDGDQPLLGSPAAEHWLVSAGTFSPLDRSYMPLVGASFDHSSSAEYHEIEDYRFGIFAASYPDFVPLLAARWRGENWGSRGWPLAWVNSGGPGSSSGGDWRLDLGIQGAGSEMIPVLGATYDDRFSEGHDPFQTMITVGPWIAGSHQPAVGVAYDGDGPLLAENSRWRTSAGTFSPLDGTYIPLAGANYVRGPEGDEYRAGLFLLDYEAFVPLVGANWSGDAAFTNWVSESAFFIGAVSDGRLDVGPVGPDGALVPLASLSVEKGPPECYGAGAWVDGQLLSVAEACPGLEGTRGWVRDVLELTTILGDQGGECFP